METFFGKIKDNDRVFYNKLIGARCVFIILGGKYYVTTWMDESDEIIMEAMFEKCLENALCENLQDHREKWKGHNYQVNEMGAIFIPQDLIEFSARIFRNELRA